LFLYLKAEFNNGTVFKIENDFSGKDDHYMISVSKNGNQIYKNSISGNKKDSINYLCRGFITYFIGLGLNSQANNSEKVESSMLKEVK